MPTKLSSTWLWAGVLPVLGLILVWFTCFRQSEPRDLLLEAKHAFQRRQFQSAKGLANDFLANHPDDPQALMVAAMSAAELQQFEEAEGYCLRVSSEDGSDFLDARCMAGNLQLLQFKNLSKAEQSFRDVLALDADHPVALERLAYLLSLQTRTEELIPIQLRRIRQGVVSLPLALSLVHSELLYPSQDVLTAFLQQSPWHAGLLLAQSRLASLEKQFSAAKEFAQQAIDSDPEFLEAHVRLGEVLLEVGTISDLKQWQQSLPPNAWNDARTWMVMGQLSERAGDLPVAVRCYWEAGKIEAALLSANYRLGQLLSQMKHVDQAEPFLQRAKSLEEYRKRFDRVAQSGQPLSPKELSRTIEQAASLGLIWEAYVFSRMAAQSQPGSSEFQLLNDRFQQQLPDLPLKRTTPAANAFLTIDLADYPLPNSVQTPASTEARPPSITKSAVSFEDATERVGIAFSFDNGFSDDISGAQRPYDFTGGGIAVIDLEGDGWPDVYFSQGCVLDDKTGEPLSGESDRIYRNLEGQRFEDVSQDCLPVNLDYSQGVSVGDFNNDGFADLFIGNLGANRLLFNNGDGTFTDVSAGIAHDAARWTTSCLICDLNGDGWPDLYSVNYLSGDIVSRICQDKTGRKNSCAPQAFSASSDQLHLNDGSGNFVDVTESCGIEMPNGKGLGIVVFDANADRQLDLFVANDGVPNFLFVNNTDDKKANFIEMAMPLGVGVNRNGISEACMGVVAEDLNQDRQIDLFVTNFLDETNTLYAGSSPSGVFEDKTWETGLGPPSLNALGFGVQAVDGELDGLPDLFVVNGHVDDFSDRGRPYRMPPMYFRNLGQMRFEQLPAQSLGSYFQGRYLGRSLARLDWDKDGAEDLLAGDLNGPTLVLHNTTQPRGSFLALALRAISSQRDAIGTRVTLITTSGVSQQRHLLSGDGYQASNERILVFGLGNEHRPVDIRVEWPSGLQQMFTGIKPNHRYIAIEDVDRLFLETTPIDRE